MRRGASNEYPQHMFSSRNKKTIATFWLEKTPYQELCVQQNDYSLSLTTVFTLSIQTPQLLTILVLKLEQTCTIHYSICLKIAGRVANSRP